MRERHQVRLARHVSRGQARQQHIITPGPHSLEVVVQPRACRAVRPPLAGAEAVAVDAPEQRNLLSAAHGAQVIARGRGLGLALLAQLQGAWAAQPALSAPLRWTSLTGPWGTQQTAREVGGQR